MHFELFRVWLGVDHVACLRPAIRGPARCRILRDHRNLHAYPVMACAIRCRDPADVEPRNGTMEERDPEWTGCAKSPEISRDSHPGNRYRVDGHHADRQSTRLNSSH